MVIVPDDSLSGSLFRLVLNQGEPQSGVEVQAFPRQFSPLKSFLLICM